MNQWPPYGLCTGGGLLLISIINYVEGAYLVEQLCIDIIKLCSEVEPETLAIKDKYVEGLQNKRNSIVRELRSKAGLIYPFVEETVNLGQPMLYFAKPLKLAEALEKFQCWLDRLIDEEEGKERRIDQEEFRWNKNCKAFRGIVDPEADDVQLKTQAI